MLQEYKIQDGESVFDVVLKLYGSLELYGKYMQDNSDNLITGDGKGIIPFSITDNVNLNFEWVPGPGSDTAFNPGVSFVFMGGNDASAYITLSATNVPILFYTANEYIINWDVDFSVYLDQTLFIELVFENGSSVTETTMQGTGTATVLQDPSWGILIEIAVGVHGDHSESVTVTSFSITGINTVSINEAVYDPSLYVSSPPELTQSAVIPSTIQTLQGQEGQTVYDLCMMSYGDIGQIYQLLQDSGISSINETDLSQQLFTYDTTFIADSTFYNYIVSEDIIMNTGEGSISSVTFLDQQNFNLILQENGFRIIIT